MKKYFYSVILLGFWACQPKVAPPEPVLPIPDERQILWQELEYYGFIHFNMNTFSDREWGFGDESPEQFNPTELDARQWAKVASEAGMKGLILTAKHHDGFVLWPSAYTEHSVKNSPWRNGEGDLIQEFVDACREFGLKPGIYYSPWDRNHPDYGKPEYITYMRNQLTELLSNYGEIFEVWFDGANGGDGWYGGANETLRVDKLTYYDWPNTHALVRELQPNAVLFSDAGPDVRWVGNESGFAYETTWSNLFRDSVYAGMPEYAQEWSDGQENGSHWVPAETNVSTRPGWYYHTYEDHKVKTLDQLVGIYYESIGRNTSLLINFPVDTRGLIHEQDEEAVLALATKIEEDFAYNLLGASEIKASSERGKSYETDNLIDQDYESYWTVPDNSSDWELTFDFGKETTFNRLLIQEYTPLGQRVKSFVLEKELDNGWEPIADGTTVGYKRILRFPEQRAERIRLRFLDAKAIPVISEIGIYDAPALLIPPKISREKSGIVTLTSPDEDLELYYSLGADGDEIPYSQPFQIDEAVSLTTFSKDPGSGETSQKSVVTLGKSKALWESADEKIIDENPQTYWTSENNSIEINLGEELDISGFTYYPMQARYPSGFISKYEFQVSRDGKLWKKVSEGEFSNIQNNPVQQEIRFDVEKARFIRLTAIQTVDNQAATFAEVGIITP
ncbi:alpha-L-fucosidase [Algoriphagus sediminis]|uniref:alpha-L-fucosidase n=1 Tax=Algoriphagus sediminis TaxID=3057113 RepID=A0ABT7YCN9_9BACT|nr:alpha-L-fucosidase [Algoriphagus sediminis]MDN3204251.1 alpha-L-fucosidase [Algoriphagus sediminis]